MTMNLWDIRNAVLDYFSSHVAASITVVPGPGQKHINPGEQFGLTLEVKNSYGNIAQGVQIDNPCYHVSIDDTTVAGLIVPPPEKAVARENSHPDSAIVKPVPPDQKNPIKELYLFRPAPNDHLIAGGLDEFAIQGIAWNKVGGTLVRIHVHGDVDLTYLFPPDQESPTVHQPVNVESS